MYNFIKFQEKPHWNSKGMTLGLLGELPPHTQCEVVPHESACVSLSLPVSALVFSICLSLWLYPAVPSREHPGNIGGSTVWGLLSSTVFPQLAQQGPKALGTPAL